jgi:predicted NAD/FAD-binding protein
VLRCRTGPHVFDHSTTCTASASSACTVLQPEAHKKRRQQLQQLANTARDQALHATTSCNNCRVAAATHITENSSNSLHTCRCSVTLPMTIQAAL